MKSRVPWRGSDLYCIVFVHLARFRSTIYTYVFERRENKTFELPEISIIWMCVSFVNEMMPLKKKMNARRRNQPLSVFFDFVVLFYFFSTNNYFFPSLHQTASANCRWRSSIHMLAHVFIIHVLLFFFIFLLLVSSRSTCGQKQNFKS